MDGCGYGYGYGQDCRFVCLLLKFVDGIREKQQRGEQENRIQSPGRSVVITQAEAPFGLDGDPKQDTNPLAFSPTWHCCNEDSAQLSRQ